MTERLLLLSYAFPPMGMPEAMLCAKRMGNLPGYRADVVTLRPFRPWMRDDPSLVPYAEARFDRICRIVASPIRIAAFAAAGRLPLLPDPFRAFNGAMLCEAERCAPGDCHALVTWSQWHSVHLVGRVLKRRHPGLPWLAHFSDPWARNSYAEFGRLGRSLNARLERRVLDEADKLLFCSEETVRLVAGTDERLLAKSVVVPHAYDPNLYDAVSHGEGSPLTLRFIGGFYGPRTPEPLFKALAVHLQHDPKVVTDLRVELVGPIPAKMLETPAARALPRGFVRHIPPVDYLESLRLMRSADILAVIDAPGDESVFLPSKLIDYIGAGRPILGFTPPGASQRVIDDVGGWTADPLDIPGMASALAASLAAARERRAAGTDAPWGTPAVRKRYSVRAVGATVARLIAAVHEGKGAAA